MLSNIRSTSSASKLWLFLSPSRPDIYFNVDKSLLDHSSIITPTTSSHFILLQFPFCESQKFVLGYKLPPLSGSRSHLSTSFTFVSKSSKLHSTSFPEHTFAQTNCSSTHWSSRINIQRIFQEPNHSWKFSNPCVTQGIASAACKQSKINATRRTSFELHSSIDRLKKYGSQSKELYNPAVAQALFIFQGYKNNDFITNLSVNIFGLYTNCCWCGYIL